MNTIRLLLIFFLAGLTSAAEITVIPKHYTACPRIAEIKIDGKIEPHEWQDALIADGFVQREPVENAPVTQQTVVRVLYDNTAIYIAAMMYDTHPDSILTELGNRDEGLNLNSDNFRFGLDPYNKRQAGYVFEVTASGVQSEQFSDDQTYDVVWESAVHRHAEGWSTEFRIPYSAIRFPASEKQLWSVQFARLIRRNREYQQWTLTPRNVQNGMLYWGTMDGIEHIEPPLRLSLTPYFSLYSERAPVSTSNGFSGYENSLSYSGGADIKYGVNESFTIDMTLLPDFSQVQSDNKVKNLSAFETIYEERRQFFKEGIDLFKKGDLFYSRRIGRLPGGFYQAAGELQDGEVLEENPDKARLLNATKLSGRNQHGLGIGIMNAVTGNTYAVIRNVNGDRRKFLTEPLTNYNILILDQQLKNNSGIFLVNTNVMREGSARDANVTTGQGTFENKKHQYRLTGRYSLSRIHEHPESGEEFRNGNQFLFAADKVSGVSWYGASLETTDDKYDKNDMGYIFRNNLSQFYAYYTYNKFKPFWKHFKQGSLSFWSNRHGRLSENNRLTVYEAGMNFFLLFHSNWSIYTDAGFQPVEGRDYYEPRVAGRYLKTHESHWGSLNFTTNYNKRLAFDFGGRVSEVPEWGNIAYGYYIIPMVRVSDRFSIKLGHYWDIYKNEHGFSELTDDEIVFGRRTVTSVENTLTMRYLFKNDMSLSIINRHYWSQGKYDRFFSLTDDGLLADRDFIPGRDFNSNYFTVDLVYNWQFAPGSSFLVVYKNQILSDTGDTSERYFSNLSRSLSDPQINSVTLKVLYYLDYHMLARKS